MTMHSPKKICILTSVHTSTQDPRIVQREARTLLAAGYEVVLVIQHERKEVIDGLRVVPLPRPKNRWDRMVVLVWKALYLALREKADVYHFHDPELIPVGLILKCLGNKVIYDVHEAYPQKILSKGWIPPKLRRLVSWTFGVFESFCARFFDHIVVADRFTAKAFGETNVSVVANYPLLRLMHPASGEGGLATDKIILAYPGALTPDRGLHVMLETAQLLEPEAVELHLMGKFANPDDEKIAKDIANVKYLGFLPLERVYAHLASAHIGLLMLQPVPAYLNECEGTNKLFEYMICGLPVLASNFPGFERFIEENHCGLCVDPTQPEKVASATLALCKDPHLRETLGRNGRRAVLEKYNWESESQVLLGIYKRMLEGDGTTPVPSPRAAGAN